MSSWCQVLGDRDCLTAGGLLDLLQGSSLVVTMGGRRDRSRTAAGSLACFSPSAIRGMSRAVATVGSHAESSGSVTRPQRPSRAARRGWRFPPGFSVGLTDRRACSREYTRGQPAAGRHACAGFAVAETAARLFVERGLGPRPATSRDFVVATDRKCLADNDAVTTPGVQTLPRHARNWDF